MTPAGTRRGNDMELSEMENMSVSEIVTFVNDEINEMEKLYQLGAEKSDSWNSEKKDASKKTQDVFECLRISLTNAAGIRNPGVKNFQEHAVNKLYADKWITDQEWDKLDKLRLIRNSFDHQINTDLGDDQRKKAALKRNREIFYPTIIEWCRDDVSWFEKRAEQIKAGIHVENSCTWQPMIDPQTGASIIPRNGEQTVSRSIVTEERPDDREPESRLISPEEFSQLAQEHFSYGNVPLSDRVHTTISSLGIPVVLSAVLAVIFGLLSDASFLAGFAEQRGLDLSQYNVSHSLSVIFILLAVLYVLFYHLTAQVLCGTAIFVLAKSATDSSFCAVLAAVLMVLLVTRFTEYLKKIISVVFYGFWLLIFVCFMPSFLSSRLGEDEPLDAYTICIRIALPMLLYLAVFALTPFVLKSFHKERPFGKALSDQEIHNHPLSVSMAPIAVLTAVLALIYRTTWAKSLILLTRYFYASPSAFWTVHAVMIALVLYFFSIMKRYRTLH